VLSTNAKGGCASETEKKNVVRYKAVQLPEARELETLSRILPHINYVEHGIAGKATVQFIGVNVQLLNGQGRTASINGAGNLVIGYDENALGFIQTGSHDLILGEEQTFTSFGGLDAGFENAITGEFASVSGGRENRASGQAAAVGGGASSGASGRFSSVGGGFGNSAGGYAASVSGGRELVANNPFEAIP
jgi:hypothetical protein